MLQTEKDSPWCSSAITTPVTSIPQTRTWFLLVDMILCVFRSRWRRVRTAAAEAVTTLRWGPVLYCTVLYCTVLYCNDTQVGPVNVTTSSTGAHATRH